MADYRKYIRKISVPVSGRAATAVRSSTVVFSRDADDDDDDDDRSSTVSLLGRLTRRALRTHRDTINHYLNLHDESNEDREHGWLMDLGPNVTSAALKGRRRLMSSIHVDDDDDDDDGI